MDIYGEVVVIKRNGADGARFPFRNLQCLFGRNPDCDIRIQLPNVAQEHAKLYVEKGKILLKNLCEDAPTKLNDKEFQIEEIRNNDVFTITERSFRFELPQKRKSSTPRRTSSNKKTPLRAVQGSPRTPVANESLKKSISKLRRTSTAVLEEDESVQSPLPSRSIPKTSNLSQYEEKENTPEDPLLHTTPSILKRKSKMRTSERKRVSFGGDLSPELFDKSLPPSTPLRKGRSPARRLSEPLQQDIPGTMKNKKRYSVGTILTKMPIMEEEEEEKGNGITERPHMPMNETPLHLVALCDTPPQDLEAPLVPSAFEHLQMEAESSEDDENMPLEPKRKLATPLRESIKKGVSLKSRRQRLATPIRKQLQAGVTLRKTLRKISTPLREEIVGKQKLKATKRKLATPLRLQIQEKPNLKEIKRKMATPLKRQISNGTMLRITKPKMSENLQKEIQSMPKLKTSKKRLATPLKRDIQRKPKLNPTKKKMGTPIRNEIKQGFRLRQTRHKMATPLRESIKSAPKLKQTKKVMSRELQKEIINGVTLKEKYRDLPHLKPELKSEIEEGKDLKKTLKSMPTPLRVEINQGITLRATKQKMNKALQDEIVAGKQLKKTKISIPTPLKKSIENGKELKKTKNVAPTPLRKQIKGGVKLKATKKKLDANLQHEIKTGTELKRTKRTVATPLRNQIKQGVSLRRTKKILDVHLQKEIHEGKNLKKTLRTAPTPLRKEIQERKKLRETKRRLSSRVQDQIKNGKVLRQTMKKSLKTPIRAQIRSGVTLCQTRRRASTSLKKDTANRRSLRNSSAKKVNESASAVVQRPVLKAKRRLARGSQEKLMLAFVPIEKSKENEKSDKPAKKKVCRRSTPKRIVALRNKEACHETPMEDQNCINIDAKHSLSPVQQPGTSDVEDHGNLSPVVPYHGNTGNDDDIHPVDLEPGSFICETSVEDIITDLEDINSLEKVESDVGDNNQRVSPMATVATNQILGGEVFEHDLGLRRLLRTPKDSKSTSTAQTENSLGLARLFKTPKDRSQKCSTEVVDNFGLKRLMNTPKDPASNQTHPVTENFGLVRLMKTPKDEDQITSTEIVGSLGLDRLMATPKNKPADKEAAVEENFGLRRLMKTPKPVRGAQASPCLDGLIHIMKMPIHEAEEVNGSYGLQGSLKTPKGIRNVATAEDIADGVLNNVFPSPVITDVDTGVENKQNDEQLNHVTEKVLVDSNANQIPDGGHSNIAQTVIRQTRRCTNRQVAKSKLTEQVPDQKDFPPEANPKNETKEVCITNENPSRSARAQNEPIMKEAKKKTALRRGRSQKQLTNEETATKQYPVTHELKTMQDKTTINSSPNKNDEKSEKTGNLSDTDIMQLTKEKIDVSTEENKSGARATRKAKQRCSLSTTAGADIEVMRAGRITRSQGSRKCRNDTSTLGLKPKRRRGSTFELEEITAEEIDIDTQESKSTSSTACQDGIRNEILVTVDDVDVSEKHTRSTRSSSKKPGNTIVKAMQENGVEKKENVEIQLVSQKVTSNARPRSKKCAHRGKATANDNSPAPAGATEGIVITPPKLRIQKTKLKAIPEESTTDSATSAEEKESVCGRTRKRLAGADNAFENNIATKHFSLNDPPIRRSTRGKSVLSEINETSTAIVILEQISSGVASSAKRKRDTESNQENKISQQTKRSKRTANKKQSSEPLPMRVTRSRKLKTQ